MYICVAECIYSVGNLHVHKGGKATFVLCPVYTITSAGEPHTEMITPALLSAVTIAVERFQGRFILSG